MNKILQTILLILVVSLGIASRMSILGWLFVIGLGTTILFGISHLLVHNFAQTSLAERKPANPLLIILSHLLFLSIFLFQIDADDSKSYSVIGFITGNEKSVYTDYGFSIVFISIIIYIALSVIIIIKARREKLVSFLPITFFVSLVSSILIGSLFLKLVYANRDALQAKKLEQTGEFTSIKSALKNPEKVVYLRIDAYDNRISEIPAEIFQLPALKEIDLTDQSVITIPAEVAKAENLEVLNLTGNNIKEIPVAICACEKLRELRIGGDISTFPPCLKTMKSLKHLTVQSNTVNELMDELLEFKNLETAHFYLKDGIINGKKLDSIYAVTGINHKY